MQRVCVFCGSSSGVKQEYAVGARELGLVLAKKNIDLVYGGGHVGLMGIVADAAMSAGAKAIGIIPRCLADKEVAHQGLTELKIVQTMHERKAQMSELSDGFIAMPGGFGTLEELFEVITWAQLGIHKKPFGLFNVAGYYDKLIEFMDYQVEQGFVPQRHREMIIVSDEAEQLVEMLESFHPVAQEKWASTRQI
ncbi:MAG: TIGR00730 family Rossman fold protein [Candidatus Melainabacteria bacterium]|nr:MAG: TIGR00730 family Rossman fold protein [Candidatus Melainabacteria bacterium]